MGCSHLPRQSEGMPTISEGGSWEELSNTGNFKQLLFHEYKIKILSDKHVGSVNLVQTRTVGVRENKNAFCGHLILAEGRGKGQETRVVK